MSTASPSTLDHLLTAVPEPAEFRQNQIQGQDLQGILALLGLDLAAMGKLQIVLKLSRFLEALDTLELDEARVDSEVLEADGDLIHITWNRDLQDPALTVDGTLTEENELLSLWARRSLSSSRAAVNGQEVDGGLRLRGEIDADLNTLRLSFEFPATEETPEIVLSGSLPILDVIDAVHA